MLGPSTVVDVPPARRTGRRDPPDASRSARPRPSRHHRPAAAGVDPRRDGRGPPARGVRPCGRRGAARVQRRVGERPDRRRAAGDDVPGPGEGPVLGRAPGRRRPAPADLVARDELDRRPRAHVRPRVAAAAGPAGVPDGPDHRGPRPLHRDGADLERPRVRRPGGGGVPRRGEQRLPGPRVRRARLVLPPAPAVLAGAPDDERRVLVLGHHRERAGVPRDPAAGRLPVPPHRRAREGPRLVRGAVPAEGRAVRALRPAVHDRDAVRPPGAAGHRPAAGRGPHRDPGWSSTSPSRSSSGSRSARSSGSATSAPRRSRSPRRATTSSSPSRSRSGPSALPPGRPSPASWGR
ncbi:hypothetical protein ABID70_002385 [Clavibacter michiganensis]